MKIDDPNPATMLASRARGGQGPQHLLEEVLRFLTVGGLATLVSVLGFNALVHGTLIGAAPLAEQPIPAYVIANIVAGCVAYAGMKTWAFSHRETRNALTGFMNSSRSVR
jgi:putative flippase GtrA